MDEVGRFGTRSERRSHLRPRGVAALLCASTIALAHCQPPTQVTVRLVTDVPCDELRGATITVGSGGEVETKASTTATTECRGTELGSLAVVPSGDRDGEVTIKVVAGVKRDAESCTAPAYGTGCIVARRTLRYVEHTKLPIVVLLRASCSGVVCPAEQTCVNGGCASATLDASACGAGCGESGLGAAGAPQPPSPLVCGDMAGLQSAAPWPMLGGCPTHAGRSGFVGAQTNRVAWRAALGGAITTGVSVAADGTVYAGASDSKLYAVDGKGSVKWSTALGSTFGGTVPAIGRDGTIYVGNDDKSLYALSATGAVTWSQPIGGKFFTAPAVGGDGAIYVGGGARSGVLALNPDGKPRWELVTKDEVLSSPAIGLTGSIYAGSRDRNVYAVNPDSSRKWTFDAGEFAGTPVIGANRFVYFAGKDSVCALDDGGALRWVSQTKGGATIPSIGADGTVYAMDVDGMLYAFDGVSGSPKWGSELGPVAATMQPVIGGDGTLYVGSKNGTFYAVGGDGKIKWQLQTGGAIGGPAAIGRDGTVYFGSEDKNLYAIGP